VLGAVQNCVVSSDNQLYTYKSFILSFIILQILLLRLYARRNRVSAAVETTDNERLTSCDKPLESDHVDPLHSLDDATKQTFQVH